MITISWNCSLEPVFLPVEYLRRERVPLSLQLLAPLPHELPQLLVAGGGDVDGLVVDVPGPQHHDDGLLTGLHLRSVGVKCVSRSGKSHLLVATVGGEEDPDSHLAGLGECSVRNDN